MTFEKVCLEISIAHRLKMLRALRHIEADELAIVLGISSHEVDRIEHGAISLRPHQVLNICSRWNVPLSYFLVEANPVAFLLMAKDDADEIDFEFLVANMPKGARDTFKQVLHSLLKLNASIGE